MPKRLALVLALMAVAVLVAPIAGAATKPKNHKVSATVTLTSIKETGNPPANGSTEDIGKATGSYGPGAVVQTTTYGSPAVGSFNGKGTLFTRQGSFGYTIAGSGAANPDGSVSFTGKGNIVSGTGPYKGAKGRFTFTGRSASGTPGQPGGVSVFQVSGSVKY